MAQGLKTGGRQKGTPKRNRAALRERLEEFFPGACICHGLNLQEDLYQLQDFYQGS